MSWSTSRLGRAGNVAATVKEHFEKLGGAPVGSAEEAAKNQLGAIAEALCKSLPPDHVVQIKAHGSASTYNGQPSHQSVGFEFSTLGKLE